MITIKMGTFFIEVRGSVNRVTTVYGGEPEPRYISVVDGGEGWSLARNGQELGVKPDGVIVRRARRGRGVNQA